MQGKKQVANIKFMAGTYEHYMHENTNRSYPAAHKPLGRYKLQKS